MFPVFCRADSQQHPADSGDVDQPMTGGGADSDSNPPQSVDNALDGADSSESLDRQGEASVQSNSKGDEADSVEDAKVEDKFSEGNDADKETGGQTKGGQSSSDEDTFFSQSKLDITKEIVSMQGPIIALSLGLAFTVILLIFVACRLRNVRRRLRKGRPLHSNEADYLINGMYL